MTDDLAEFVHRIGATLDAVDCPWMVVGSVASSLNGAPRMTQDVNFVAKVGRGAVDRLLAYLDRWATALGVEGAWGPLRPA